MTRETLVLMVCSLGLGLLGTGALLCATMPAHQLPALAVSSTGAGLFGIGALIGTYP